MFNVLRPNVSKLIELVKKLVEVVDPVMMNENRERPPDLAQLKDSGTLQHHDESPVKVTNEVKASLLQVVPLALPDGKAVGNLLDDKDKG